MAMINLIESGTCQAGPAVGIPTLLQKDSVSTKIVKKLTTTLLTSFQPDTKTFHLLAEHISRELAGHKQKHQGAGGFPSPIKSSIWPIVSHDKDDKDMLFHAVGDAGTSDGTGEYNTLRAMDGMDAVDLPQSILVFDTTPHGTLSGYRSEVPLKQLFARFVRALENMGLNCAAANKMVPNPNHIYDYQTTNDTLIEIYEAFYKKDELQ